MFNLGAIPLPVLAVLIAALAVGALASLAKLRWTLPVVAFMFFVGTISVATTPWGAPIQQWLYPLQANRSALFMILGGILGVAVVANMGSIAGRRLAVQGLLVLATGLYAGLLRVAHEGPGSGVVSIAFAAFTMGALVYLLPALIETWEDVLRLLRTLQWTNVFWLFAVIVQFGLNPAAMSKGRAERFFGLLGNAQHAAVYLGVMGALALWLALNDDRNRRRGFWLIIAIVNVGFLVWTGSRTGTALFAMGAVVTFYGRLGRTILVLPLLMLLGWIGIGIANMVGFDWGTAERLTSLEDTRSSAWLNMLQSGMSSPIFGVGIEDAGDSENSYLYAFASYGLGMVAIILVLILASARICWRIFRLRPHLDPDRRALADLVLGYNAMYFSGAMLEGYLMARVSGSLVLILVFAAIGTALLEHGFEPEAEEEAWEDEEEAAWTSGGELLDPDVAEGYGAEPA